MHQQRTGRGGLRRATVTAAMVKTAGAYGLAKGAKAGRYARRQARQVPHATGRGGGEASAGDDGSTAGPPPGSGGAPPLPGGQPFPNGDGPVVPVQAGARRRSLTAPRALPATYNGRPSRGNGHAGGLAGRGLAQRGASGYRLTDAGRHRLAQLRRPRSPMAQPPSQRPHYTPYTDASQAMGRPSNAPWSRWARQRSADHHVWRQSPRPSREARRQR